MRHCFPSAQAQILQCKADLRLEVDCLTFVSPWQTRVVIPLREIRNLDAVTSDDPPMIRPTARSPDTPADALPGNKPKRPFWWTVSAWVFIAIGLLALIDTLASLYSLLFQPNLVPRAGPLGRRNRFADAEPALAFGSARGLSDRPCWPGDSSPS